MMKVHLALVGALLLAVSPSAGAAPVDYTSFQGTTYSLTPWGGRDVTVLTPSPDLDAGVMDRLVQGIDAGYDVYRSFTGRSPTPLASTTYNGTLTVAEVPNGATCGAGCGYLGFTGIELTSDTFARSYGELGSTGRYDQAPFYELGRNFWFYGDQLGALDPLVTGYAIAGRFISMDEAGLPGAPFNGVLPYEEFRRSIVVDLLASYRADPSLDWTDTLAVGRAPDNPYGWGAADLAAGFFYQIYADHGLDGYRDFFAALATLSPASTQAEAVANFERAAQLGVGRDYAELFDNTRAVAVPEPATVSLLGVFAGLSAFLSAARAGKTRRDVRAGGADRWVVGKQKSGGPSSF